LGYLELKSLLSIAELGVEFLSTRFEKVKALQTVLHTYHCPTENREVLVYDYFAGDNF
jgi:hypothetical protein